MRSILFVLLTLLTACFRESPTPPHPEPPQAAEIATPAVETWHPARPTWVMLPAQPTQAELMFFLSLTNGMSQMEVGLVVPSPTTTAVPSRLATAARFVSDHLPPNLRWQENIRQAALAVADGRLRAITPHEIETSNELVQATNPFFEYDGVHDRLVYTDLGPTDLLLRASLVYALAERAHLHDLARLADVRPRTYALVLRACDNLRSEFKAVTYIQAMEAMTAWVNVDPDLAPTTALTRLNGRVLRPLVHAVVYPSLETLLSTNRPAAERQRQVMHDALSRLEVLYPGHSSELCGRFVISRGQRYGAYLLPSDDLPEILPYLEYAPELNASAVTNPTRSHPPSR